MSFDKSIGVAGCGRMGLPMARVMARSGIEVHGFDVRPPAEFGDFTERMTNDPLDFANKCQVLFTVVRDAEQTDKLLFDDQALLTIPNTIETLVISSTLSPSYLASVKERAPSSLTLIDAPMSGAAVAADEANLSFMLGGETADLDALQPLFYALGTRFHRMGAFGSGMTAKVLNNYVAAAAVVANRQVFEWADQLGIKRQALRALMHDSSGQTWFGSKYNTIEFARDGYDDDNSIGILKKDVECCIDSVSGDADESLNAAILDRLNTMKPDKPGN